MQDLRPYFVPPKPPKLSFFVSPEQLRVFLILLYPESEAYT